MKCKYMKATMVFITAFFLMKAATFTGMIHRTDASSAIEHALLLAFGISFAGFVRGYIAKGKAEADHGAYVRRLNNAIISQSQNYLFYEGDIDKGAQALVRQVTEAIETDRCSIWLYNSERDSISCEQLYVREEGRFYKKMVLFKKDFGPYFEHLEKEPIIAADDAETHPATKCFKEAYLRPNSIKSMLDVPIVYKGEAIGVICIESLSNRNWNKAEIDFAQMLSSLYSFAYSVRESSIIHQEYIEMENFIDEASLISKADRYGKITYVNKKFNKVSGYALEEVLGKDHRIVNSGTHPKNFWTDMYDAVIKRKEIWNSVVTNKAKDGHEYYVDTYIKANFSIDTGELTGFTSIRQDVTDVYNSLREIDEKNTYLEHAAKILRHDMHSGINTYIPRGIKSLERRLTAEQIKDLKIDTPLRLLKEGLAHTQKVYRGVYEFTNLVKKDSTLHKEPYDLKSILSDFLRSTSYSSQVAIDELVVAEVNESLFCTAIDNLIRNGLKYNDSDFKMVAIFMDGEDTIAIQDNGRGMTQEEFNHLSKPYTRRLNQKETGTGLGLNICTAILKEHGFSIACEKNETGTKIKIKIK
jgi:PAS domain S-box-containing protein